MPNPLFDLAGIMCGQFGIPFWEFFFATMIGKAIIKTHIQVCEGHLESLYYFPKIGWSWESIYSVAMQWDILKNLKPADSSSHHYPLYIKLWYVNRNFVLYLCALIPLYVYKLFWIIFFCRLCSSSQCATISYWTG